MDRIGWDGSGCGKNIKHGVDSQILQWVICSLFFGSFPSSISLFFSHTPKVCM